MGSFFLPSILSLTSRRQHSTIMFGVRSQMRIFCCIKVSIPPNPQQESSKPFIPLYPLYNLSKSLRNVSHYDSLLRSYSIPHSQLLAPPRRRPQTRDRLTFFGYPDNCDSTGCYYSETAYQCSNPDGSSRNGAQGDGSYNNPLSVAFQPGGNFQQCGIIYMAYL